MRNLVLSLNRLMTTEREFTGDRPGREIFCHANLQLTVTVEEEINIHMDAVSGNEFYTSHT